MHETPLAPGSPVGLVGLGYYTLTVADLCSEAGHSVAFAVDDREGTDGDPSGAAYWMNIRGIPVLTATEFVERMRSDPVPLVATRVECAPDCAPEDEPFGRAGKWVRRVSGAGPLVHPVSLLAQVPPVDCPVRYAVFGFPGSGNMLAQNLIEGLYARRVEPVPPAFTMRAGLSEAFFHTIVSHLRARLASLLPTNVRFVPHDFGTMLVAVTCGESRAGVAFHVPSSRHLGLHRFPTHSRPTTAAADYFASADAPCVAVVRHPLEALLSQANKIARPVRAVFDGPHFLDNTASSFTDWHSHLLANRDRVCTVRYEDLHGRRIDELRRLAEWVGRPVSDAEAEALYDRYLNRNLPALVPTHFYRGGNDKWRTEFEPRDLQRVLARMPVEMFTAFGYDVPTEADLVPAPFVGTPKPVSIMHTALLEACEFYPVAGSHGIRVTSGDAALADALRAVFADPDLQALLATGQPHPAAEALRAAA